MADAQHRVRVGAGGPRVAVPSHRRRADGAGGGGDDGGCEPDCRSRYAARAEDRAARLPDLRAGPRRSSARAGRGDRIFDDAPAPARVRARRGQRCDEPTRPGAAPRERRRAWPSAASVSTIAARRPRSPRRMRASRRRRHAQLPASGPGRRLAERAQLPADPAAWPAFVAGLRLAPMAAQLAAQTELKSVEGNVLTLALPAAHKHLADKAVRRQAQGGARQATGRKWMLAFEVGSLAEASLAAQKRQSRPSRSPGPRPRFGASLSCRTCWPDLMRK